jgi:hypothetical protein
VYREGKVAADAMEALIGAIYLDQGLHAAAEFVAGRMLPALAARYEASVAQRTEDGTGGVPASPSASGGASPSPSPTPTSHEERDAYFRQRLQYVGERADPAPWP